MARIDREIADKLLRQEGSALKDLAEKSSAGYERVSSAIACYGDAIARQGGQLRLVAMEINSMATRQASVPQKELPS